MGCFRFSCTHVTVSTCLHMSHPHMTACLHTLAEAVSSPRAGPSITCTVGHCLTHTCTHTHTHTYTHTHTHAHTLMHTHTHSHIRTYKQTHTHTHRVNHSKNAIVKPQGPTPSEAKREVEEAMRKVREAQMLIQEAIVPGRLSYGANVLWG